MNSPSSESTFLSAMVIATAAEHGPRLAFLCAQELASYVRACDRLEPKMDSPGPK